MNKQYYTIISKFDDGTFIVEGADNKTITVEISSLLPYSSFNVGDKISCRYTLPIIFILADVIKEA